MSGVGTSRSEELEERRQRGLQVTNWPLLDEPWRAAAAGLLCLAVGLLGGWASQSLLMGVVAAGSLALAFWKIWLPITTEFGPHGLVLTVLGKRRRIAWRDIDHLELGTHGLFIWGRGTQPAPRPFQTLYLPWSKRRDEVAVLCDESYSLGAASRSAGEQSRTVRSDRREVGQQS